MITTFQSGADFGFIGVDWEMACKSLEWEEHPENSPLRLST
jgi:hypothetical protein